MTRVEGIVQSLLSELGRPFVLGDEQAFISASIGITVFPDDSTDIDELLKNADQALYQAEDGGRNRFGYFTAALQQTAQTRARLATDMRSALLLEQFWIAYQPIVELGSNQVHKAEALLRWRHPSLGDVCPTSFIPIAESNGQIISIGDWVFQQAAKQVMAWRHAHHPHAVHGLVQRKARVSRVLREDDHVADVRPDVHGSGAAHRQRIRAGIGDADRGSHGVAVRPVRKCE